MKCKDKHSEEPPGEEERRERNLGLHSFTFLRFPRIECLQIAQLKRSLLNQL